MRKKKTDSQSVIAERMKELHHLVDKWEQRFVETANETLDEKIDSILKQEKALKQVNKELKRLVAEFSEGGAKAQLLKKLQDQENDSDLEGSFSMSLEDSDDKDLAEIRKLLEQLSTISFPLKPSGTLKFI